MAAAVIGMVAVVIAMEAVVTAMEVAVIVTEVVAVAAAVDMEIALPALLQSSGLVIGIVASAKGIISLPRPHASVAKLPSLKHVAVLPNAVVNFIHSPLLLPLNKKIKKEDARPLYYDFICFDNSYVIKKSYEI